MPKHDPGTAKCHATGKKTGKPCNQWALPWQDVCRYHGGNTPQALAAADKRRRLYEATQAAEKLGTPIDTTPEQAILDEISRAAGMVAYYQAQVETIAETDTTRLVYGVTKSSDGPLGTTTTKEASTNIWIQLWNQERDRLARVSLEAVKVGIEQRRVKLAEDQGALVAAVVRRVLDRLNLTAEQAALIPTIVPEELRALST